MKPTTPTPASFPKCAPQFSEGGTSSCPDVPVVRLLQGIHRPGDIKLEHFEALKIQVVTDAPPDQIIPDTTFIAPINDWSTLSSNDIALVNTSFRKPLSNGNLSPGIQTYIERHKELSIDNSAAFRTIRRIPPPSGEAGARLGNGYEFFKNLDLLSGYWHDTSLPTPSTTSDSAPSSNEIPAEEKERPSHLRTHIRSGLPSQLPLDYRQNLLTAFIKLVAYDFGCNVSFPRCEPRLHLAPPQFPSSTSTSTSPSQPSFPSSYFNSSALFIYRTPTDRHSARAGILEGPVAAISCRTSTTFATPSDSNLDFAREIVAVLLTAQYRSREHKTERRPGEGKWWAEKPRWGGGPGGPIGREVDTLDDRAGNSPTTSTAAEAPNTPTTANDEKPSSHAEDIKRAISASATPSTSTNLSSSSVKRSKRAGSKSGTLPIYDNYRKMLPPSSNWDRKMRYSTIGKTKDGEFDDIFLISALNHHVAVVRVRVPLGLLGLLEGKEVEGPQGEGDGWEKLERLVVWRSKWYDLFKVEERLEALRLLWGMMAFLMRSEEGNAGMCESGSVEEAKAEKMDVC